MAVIKLTASKKALQFIDEFGNVFQTSVTASVNLLNGNNRTNIIPLTRLPFKVNPDRFKKSELYNPNGLPDPGLLPVEISNANDAIGVKSTTAAKTKKSFVDKKVW